MRVKIVVKTNAKSSEIVKFDDEKDAYIVNVKSQPIEGKANKEIIKLFHKKLIIARDYTFAGHFCKFLRPA